jgi:hypothetical protein
MPPSARITVRLPPALAALVADRVRQGQAVSDIIRAALEAYCGLPPPQVSASLPQVSDTTAQVSDMLSDVVAAVSDMQRRLACLEARLEAPLTQHALRPAVSGMVADKVSDRPATPGPATGTLAPHILQIAEVAGQYDKLSLTELAQLLFDRHVYRATSQAGQAVPVNRGTLKKWLDRARAVGVL